MRALAFDDFGGALTVRDLPVPAAPAGGAVVDVHATGVCRSDWHAWMGHDSDVDRLPHVPGHEFAGVVSSVGDGVDTSWVGRRVTAPFVYACGSCAECRQGAGQVCSRQQQPGFTLQGSFAEQVVVTSAATNLVELPDGIPPHLAAGLGCRVATAFRAVHARGRVAQGETVVVIGCGGVGLSVVALAAALGARVVAVDRAPEALSAAARLGADRNLRWSADVVETVRRETGGAHVTFDCVGSPELCVAAVSMLRPLGRHVQVGLLPPAVGPVELPMGIVIGRELEVLGTHGLAAPDYAALLAEVTSGRLDLGALVSPAAVGGLEEAAALLARMGEEAFGGIRVVDPRR
jgi:alcohol dehydrogenase